MIEWVLNIFDSPSDKARFVTVVFSAIVAVLILLLNQYFINKRENRQMFVTKLEEIYTNILEFQKKGAEFISTGGWQLDETDKYKERDTYQEVSNSAQSITMLFELYFPKEKIASSEIESTVKILRYKLEYNAKEGDETFDTYMKIHDEFEEKIQQLKNICKEISQKLK